MNYRLITISYIAIIIFIIIAADMGQLNFTIRWIHSIPYGDKLGHFILVGMLAFVVNLSLGAARWHWLGWSMLKGSLIIFILITLEECSQLFISYRHFDIGDLLSNYLGILLLGHLAIYFSSPRINEAVE
jgi:VanZ family protein